MNKTCVRQLDGVVARRWEMEAHSNHRKRVKQSQSQVDSSKPSTFALSHLRSAAKKKQLHDDRIQQIVSDNTKLVEKMMVIHRKGTRMKENFSSSSFLSAPLTKGQALYSKQSLNRIARNRELALISEENKKIRDRIKGGRQTQSSYSRDDMAKAEVERQKYVKNISRSHRYPKINLNKKREPKEYEISSFWCDLDISLQRRLKEVMAQSLKQKLELKLTITSEKGEPIQLKTARQVRSGKIFHRGNPIPHAAENVEEKYFDSTILQYSNHAI